MAAMSGTLRTAARRLIVGSPLESPVKRLHYMLTRAKNSLYDVQTIEIMRRVLERDSVAVDVGAFEGSMLRHMLRFAPGGRHYAFEPIPRLSRRLYDRFPTCHVINAAVGEALGTETFREVIATPALSGLERRVDLPPETAIREIPVQVETLDHAIPPDVIVAFVKIDVEGAELGVLRGGRATLARCRPVIVFECGLGGADSYGSRPADLFDLVTTNLGLRIFLLGAWLGRQAPLARDEFVRQFEQSLNYYFVAAP
jgi:FkbM family methyltransferase